MLHDTMLKRFRELDDQFSTVPFHGYPGATSGSYAQRSDWLKWGTSVQNLILASFGETSPHYQNFVSAMDRCTNDKTDVETLHGVFRAAREDFEGGYVFSVDLRVSGEVLGDFVALAKQALAEGYKDVAAVLASAALV